MPPVTTADSDAQLMPRDVSDFIFEAAVRSSAIQQVAPEEPLSDAGRAIPVITGEPVAAWVTEGERKPVSDGSLGTKLMDPEKISVIVPFSDEFTRRDNTNFPDRLRDKIAEAFGKAFDTAAVVAASGPFSVGLGSTTNDVEVGTAATADGGVDADVIDGMRQVAADGFRVRGFAFDDTFEVELLDARDTSGRPIYNPDATEGAVGRLKGRTIAYGEGLGTAPSATPAATDGIVGIGGDWRQSAWGQVGDIEYDVSDQAALDVDGTVANMLLLWQENLVAVRAEAWYGWVVNDLNAFVKYRDNA